MKNDGTECSETSAYKIQTPGNYPEESIQRSEHGESLKPRMIRMYVTHVLNEVPYSWIYGPGSSVGIATAYGLDGPGSNSGGGEIFAPVQTGPGPHPASCTMGTGFLPGGGW
jgi:hypothetical protein